MATHPFLNEKRSSRMTGKTSVGLLFSFLPMRFFMAIMMFVILAGTVSVQSADINPPKAPTDVPTPVVNETYNVWTLTSGLLYWGDSCPGGEISFAGFLRRLPVNGGNQITIGTSTPTTCVTYLDLVADSSGVYYYNASVGPRIEARMVGSPTVAKPVLNLSPSQIPAGERLAVDGNFVYWLTSDQLVRVGKDGSNFGSVATGLSGTADLFVTGGNVYWLDSTGLWETNVGCGSLPCDKRQLSAVAGSQLLYYYQGSPIFLAGPRFDYIAGMDIHHVSCSNIIATCSETNIYAAPSDGNPWDLGRPATDGTNLFWEEGYFNIPGAATGRLRRMPLNGGTAVDIATNLYMIPGPVYIDTNAVYFSSVDNSTTDILKLPLNASALVRDLTADAFEVTQGIQSLANDVPLVADKTTYVRAYGLENSGLPALAVDAALYGTQNNQPLPGSPLHPINGDIAINSAAPYNRANLKDGWLFRLPDSWIQTGAISLRLVVDPLQTYSDPNRLNNELSQSVDFFPLKPVCNIFIPVRTDAPLPSVNIANFWQMIDYANRLWPTANYLSYHQDDSLEKLSICSWHGLPYPCTVPYHLPGDTWELFTDMALRRLFTFDPSECSYLISTTHLVGMVNPSTNTGTTTGTGMTSVFNFAWVKFSNDLAASNDPFAPLSGETLAHELAHNLGREHVACGGADSPDPNYPYPTDQIDNVGNANHYGFDIKSLTPIAPDAAKDFMGYCTPKWTSDYTWKALYPQLIPILAASQNPPSPALANATNDVLVSGAITPTASTGELGYAWNFPSAALGTQLLQKWQQNNDQNAADLAASAPLTVTYHVRLLNPSGAVLADQTVNPLKPDIHEAPSLTNVFLATFPAPAGTVAKIQLMQDNTVLASRVPGSSAPTVSLLKPAGGEIITDQLDLSWKAQDIDHQDVLLYTVQYSPDNGRTWFALATNVGNLPGATTTSLTLHLSGTPGSLPGEARIRVAASDGYNTSLAASNPFTVTNRKPEPFILTPAASETTPAGQEALLRGGANDAEDGIIKGAGLSWTVDSQTVGSGEQVSLPGLAPGEHTVVLTARDSVSQTAATQTTLTILPLSIPTGNSPVLDGYCDDTSYANGTQVLLKPYPGSTQASARLLRDGSAIWVCFTGLELGAVSPGSFAGVHIDPNHSRDNLAQTDDYGFFAGEDGSVITTAGDGAGGFANPGPGGLTAQISATKNGWSAEMRIDSSVLGGLDHIVGLNLGQYSVTQLGDDYVWPYSSIFNQPKTWATTALAALPVISQVKPGSLKVGSLGVTLVISGENFLDGSQVLWDGTPLSTTFGTRAVISATVPAAKLSTAGSFPIVVRNPGSIDSGPAAYPVDNPEPAITSLLPNTTRAEGHSFTLHVNGSSFVNGAKVSWNGQELPTTFVNSGQLNAQVDASLIASGEVASVTVLNPGPGGGASAAAPFTVQPNYSQFMPLVNK